MAEGITEVGTLTIGRAPQDDGEDVRRVQILHSVDSLVHSQ